MEDSFRGWINGQKIPNPEAFGFKWKPMQKLLAEQQRIWRESRENGRRYEELKAEIERLRHQEVDQLAESIRSGTEEPDGSAMARAQGQLEKCQKRAKAIARALEAVNGDILATVNKHGEEWSTEAQALAEEKAAEVKRAAAALRTAQTELYRVAALRDWVRRPERGFAYAPGPSSLSTFNGTVKAPEVFDALVADARKRSDVA